MSIFESDKGLRPKMPVNCEGATLPTEKGRRIVTWTIEEDDVLREQISIHGSEKWSIIAAKFKDKTARQCRRRWCTYLNSDFKKGSWSPEEDTLLCEAQKIFGNRWTEIAKVVSGRTDNAVKNRFTTLCKKRAVDEALNKENSATYINTNNKRPIADSNVFHSQGSLLVASPLEKTRFDHASNLLENCNIGSVSDTDSIIGNLQPQPPFAVLTENRDRIDTLHCQHQVTIPEELIDGNVKYEGFLKKDDPKILALKQQAELLSSLAVKVLDNFLNDSKDHEVPKCNISDVDLHLDQFKDLVELNCCNTENQPSQGQPDLYDSPSSSDYSTGSTIVSTNSSEQIEQTQSEDAGAGLQNIGTRDEILLPCADEVTNAGDVSALSATEFSSPQVTPLFRSLAATIPSPRFSESERHFLMKKLGIESPTSSRINPSQPPPCRRALVHTL